MRFFFAFIILSPYIYLVANIIKCVSFIIVYTKKASETPQVDGTIKLNWLMQKYTDAIEEKKRLICHEKKKSSDNKVQLNSLSSEPDKSLMIYCINKETDFSVRLFFSIVLDFYDSTKE